MDDAALGVWPDGDAIRDWAAEGMAWAVEAGLIRGSEGYLKPGDGATRAQTAAILHRFYELVK